jgi:hypothetical protein
LGAQKAVETEDILVNYADPEAQVNRWPEFVKLVLGQETAVPHQNFGTRDPVYTKSL